MGLCAGVVPGLIGSGVDKSAASFHAALTDQSSVQTHDAQH